jgi:hypothetical protein
VGKEAAPQHVRGSGSYFIGIGGLAIDFPTIADADDFDNKLCVSERVENSIVPNAKAKGILTLHPFYIRCRVRIIARLFQRIQYPLTRGVIQTPKVALRPL